MRLCTLFHLMPVPFDRQSIIDLVSTFAAILDNNILCRQRVTDDCGSMLRLVKPKIYMICGWWSRQGLSGKGHLEGERCGAHLGGCLGAMARAEALRM